MITKHKISIYLLLCNKPSQNFVSSNNNNLLFFTVLWVRNLGRTWLGSSFDYEASHGVIHLAAFCWCLGWAKRPTIPESMSAASPRNYLGHSMWAVLLTSLLASRERRSRSYHLSGLRSPRMFFLPNCMGQSKSKDSPNQEEGIEILSPPLNGRN